jgi:hypothetical protein
VIREVSWVYFSISNFYPLEPSVIFDRHVTRIALDHEIPNLHPCRRWPQRFAWLNVIPPTILACATNLGLVHLGFPDNGAVMREVLISIQHLPDLATFNV